MTYQLRDKGIRPYPPWLVAPEKAVAGDEVAQQAVEKKQTNNDPQAI